MLLELLKNSMRATVELHGMENMPPIRIIIADGEDNEDVSALLCAVLGCALRYFVLFCFLLVCFILQENAHVMS